MRQSPSRPLRGVGSGLCSLSDSRSWIAENASPLYCIRVGRRSQPLKNYKGTSCPCTLGSSADNCRRSGLTHAVWGPGVRVRLYSQTQPRKYLYRILPSVIGCAVHESGSGCDMTGHGPRPIVPPQYRCHGIGAGQDAFGGCAHSLWKGTGKVFQDLVKKSMRKFFALKCTFLSIFQG